MKLSKHANEDKNINKEQLESNKRRIERHISEIISSINDFHMWISEHGKYNEMERVYAVYNSIGTLAKILKEKIDELNNVSKEYEVKDFEVIDAEEFSKASLVNSLIKLSDELDKDDLTKYSNFVDSLIKKIS